MDDSSKTKAELIEGLRALRKRLAEIEDARRNDEPVVAAPAEGVLTGDSLKALQESEEKYRTLFQDSEFAKSLTMEGKIIDVNPAWLRLHGYDSKDEVIGMDVLDVIHPEDREILIMRRNATAHERARVCEYRDLRKDGTAVDVEVHSSQIILDGVEAIHTAIQDITKRRWAEREKEGLQAQLLQAQKMEALGVLAGGVAHDFNNQLTTIRGFTEMLMMEADKESPVYADLERIFNACNRSASLVQQLLLFSRKHQVEFQAVDPNQVLKDVLKMVQRLIGEDIRMRVDLGEDLPPIWADPTNLEQVVLNMVVNARDAMPEGGELTIKTREVVVDDEHSRQIAKAEPGRFVCLSVADTGEGISEEVLQHIFEPFFTTKEMGRGTGLGLSVVYGIVEDHKGWIEVDTRPGQGAEFRVFLPISSKPVDDREEPPEALGWVKGNGERILVVEDDREILHFASKVLREHGYCPFEASSAEEGLKIFEQESDLPLVLSDCVLPDLPGLELVERLLSRKPDLGVVMMSGYADDRSHCDIIREKGFEFLQKPYGLREMLQAVWRGCFTISERSAFPMTLRSSP